MNLTTKQTIRKLHRYLGVFIGIQFLFWTVSGIYFSWTDIDEIHGDHLLMPVSAITKSDSLVSPTAAIQNLQSTTTVDSIHQVRLVRILDKPVYQIHYFKGHSGENSHVHVHYALADAKSGLTRQPLTEQEAIAVALEHVMKPAVFENSKYLDRIEGDHEYREKPLPAWAITFSEPACTI